MLKICHLLDELKIGGLEKTVVNLILYSEAGYQQQVWCLKQKGILAGTLESRGIKVKEFGFEGGIKLAPLLTLIKELKKEHFDIINFHGLFPSMWGGLSAFFAAIPVRIHYCHNVYNLIKKERIKLKALGFLLTRIIAISKAVKKCLIESVGMRPGKIEVIYNSAPECNSTLNLEQRLNLKAQLGIAKNDFVIGNISRMEERKGHIYLIEAMASDYLRNADCKCLIVGDGLEMENLQAKVKMLNLEKRVIFLGWQLEINKFLSIMDVFILPSIRDEGLGICLAEAASARLPLVGTDIDGIPEIIQDGVNGFIVPEKVSGPIAEKIKYLIDNPQERKRMAENSRKIWQEKFTLEGMIKKIENLYEEYV